MYDQVVCATVFHSSVSLKFVPLVLPATRVVTFCLLVRRLAQLRLVPCLRLVSMVSRDHHVLSDAVV